MKIKRWIMLVVTLCLMAGLSACKKDFDDTYTNTDGEVENDVWAEDISSEQDNTFSLEDVLITEEFTRKVFDAMTVRFFQEYKAITAEDWKTVGPEERHLAYEAFFGMLSDLNFPVNTTEEIWIQRMDEDVDFYTDQMIWSFAFENLGLSGAETLVALHQYIQGIEDGKYTPLHRDIFSAADDITVEYYTGQYLLCVGGNHNIAQLTKSWTMEDSSFVQSGTITPISTGDVFENTSVSYSIGGENGKFTEAYFGEADLLPVLKAVGAVGEDGTMLQEQIQISAKSSFDAPILYVLTEGDNAIITFAVVKYSETDAKYVWDGKLITTAERSCFDKDGNFCYIDENGTLQMILP